MAIWDRIRSWFGLGHDFDFTDLAHLILAESGVLSDATIDYCYRHSFPPICVLARLDAEEA